MYYYGYQNYAAGVIGILVLAVALTAFSLKLWPLTTARSLS